MSIKQKIIPIMVCVLIIADALIFGLTQSIKNVIPIIGSTSSITSQPEMSIFFMTYFYIMLIFISIFYACITHSSKKDKNWFEGIFISVIAFSIISSAFILMIIHIMHSHIIPAILAFIITALMAYEFYAKKLYPA